MEILEILSMIAAVVEITTAMDGDAVAELVEEEADAAAVAVAVVVEEDELQC